MPPSKQHILDANREKIIKEYQEGKSTCQLGREIGVSNAAVYMYLKNKCGIMPPKHNNKFEDKKAEMAALYDQGLSVSEIAKQLNVPLSSANRYLRKLEKDTSRYKTNPEIPVRTHTTQILKRYSEGVGCYLLAKEFNTQESTILKILHENDVEIRGPRQYFFDQDFFEKIDTQDKAYILGWCFSDGYNSDDDLSISITDREVLEHIKEKIGQDSPIEEIDRSDLGYKTIYRLRMSSVKMCQDLANLGCVRAKSLIVQFPAPDKVPTELMSHFLRGMFDGNGTITKDNQGRWFVNICSSDDFCAIAKIFLNEELNCYFGTTKCISVSKVQTGTIDTIKAFLDYIYKDASFKLDRKYQKYLQFLNETT